MTILSGHIENATKAFAKHSFLETLAKQEHPSKDIFNFLPDMAHYVMSYSDFNKYVLKFENPMDSLEEAVNKHASENETHCHWFIADLKELNLDKTNLLSEHLYYLWSDQLSPSRILFYELIKLVVNKPAKNRLAIIEAVKSTGNVVLQTLLPITTKICLAEKIKLSYCGETHFAHESKYVFKKDENLIDSIKFTDKEINDLIIDIDTGFNAYSLFLDQLYLKLTAPSPAVATKL